jgi:hypothetical protein
LAIKYNEDDFYDNTFYSRVGGVSLQELNRFEFDFLTMCNFEMAVDDEKFFKYHSFLQMVDDTEE